MCEDKREKKLKDTSGMAKAIEDVLQQAWERGYKYGLLEAEKKHQVVLMIGGEQIYPEQDRWHDILDGGRE